MIRNGFQRLVLLGSAGYQRAELPLDDAVSLIAPNNTGKTSLINALQFLLIIHKQRMDFGSHDDAKTRRFYFPNNSAYILLEVLLPQTGTVVFGCVGKGVSYDYDYFAYKGELVVEDYRLPGGHLVQQPQLISHLATKGRSVYQYDASEFIKRIYGGKQIERRNEPDFTIFKLENANNAQTFQQVLTRTLRLDKLTSSDVKKYLLQIFKNDLPNHNINFKQVWDEAFHDVNADRAQYEAAVGQSRHIAELELAYNERLMLRGKLIDWQDKVNSGLTSWQAHYLEQSQALAQKDQNLLERQRVHNQKVKELVRTEGDLTRGIAQLKDQNSEQAQLQSRFSLIRDRSVLQRQFESTKADWLKVSSILQQAGGRPITAIMQAIKSQGRQLGTLEKQKQNADDNLYRHLGKILSDDELQRLNRVISEHAMVLGRHEFTLDPAAIRQTLESTSADRLRLGGIEMQVTGLQPGHQQLPEIELEEQIRDIQRDLLSLEQQLDAAQSLAETRQKAQLLESETKQLEKDLADYDRLQVLIDGAAIRLEELKSLERQLQDITDQLAKSDQEAETLRVQREEVSTQKTTLENDNRQIDNLRNRRLDLSADFAYLRDLPHHPWLGERDWPLDQLAQRMTTFHQDCQQLNRLNHDLQSGLRELHSGGLTRYQYSEGEDQELLKIIEFSHQLPQEREALEKKARSAVVNVTASLRELRDGLLTFQSKMREFNRLIGHRRLSDLKTFKIEAEDEVHLVEAINVLITKAEQVESGDSFELFNQDSVLDDAKLDRAKQILIDEGNARLGLKVEDLFRLVFVVGKVDQPAESFEDIDSAASNGTVLMAKLVTGLAMLYLMQDKRRKLHAICYLDEALALDRRNQASLIETAHEFGFSLIFASPDPLTTVRYCVPIHHSHGHNYISRESWQVLEPLTGKAAEHTGAVL